MIKQKNGFTLIEVVIAIFILAFALVGVYNAFSKIVILTANISDRFTAAYLAQEGMEIIRNIRDNNWVNNQDWKTGLVADGCSNGCDYEADYTAGTKTGPSLYPYGGNSLRLDSNGFYTYVAIGTTQTKFSRKITIKPATDPNVIEVSVQVFFTQKPSILNPGAEPGVIEAKEYLYNWY